MPDPTDNVDYSVFAQRLAEARGEWPDPVLPKGGGGGTSDGMDANIQRLDDKIDNRFFWLLGIFGAGFVLLAGLILSTTDKLAAKIDGVSDQVAQVGQRVAKLEGAAEAKPPAVTAVPPPRQ